MKNLLNLLTVLLIGGFGMIAEATDYKTLAVSVKYLDASSTSVLGLTGSVNTVSKFWNENSGGKHTFTMTVHPQVLVIPKNKPLPGTTCNYSFMSDSYNAIVAAGIDPKQYQRAIIVVPMNTNCPYKGFQSYLTSGVPASFTSSTNTQYIAHEMGHTLGLGHANNISCKSTTTGLYEPLNLTKCSYQQYGGYFDIMGKELMLSNAVHRAKLGIMTPMIHALGAGEATYKLPPVGANVTAPNALKIVLPNNRALWLEYRVQIGYDTKMTFANTQGALVWAVGSYGNAWCGDYAPCVVDMNLEEFYSGVGKAALLVGQTYTNQALGVTISVTDKTPEYLTVVVKN